jgi:hypothetical protein
VVVAAVVTVGPRAAVAVITAAAIMAGIAKLH